MGKPECYTNIGKYKLLSQQVLEALLRVDVNIKEVFCSQLFAAIFVAVSRAQCIELRKTVNLISIISADSSVCRWTGKGRHINPISLYINKGVPFN